LGELKDCDQLSEEDLKSIVQEMQGAFDNLIQVAIDNNVLFVVLAGDIYDNPKEQEALQGDFRNGLLKLEKHGIDVYIIHGNHDPLREGYKTRRELPGNAKVFGTDAPHEFTAAETDEGVVSVAGISFASEAVTENLAKGFSNLPRENAQWRVGVLHTSMAGNNGHDPYAPCSKEDLRDAPVGYWALGHIHLRDDNNSLGTDRWWAYSGNLQGRNFKPSECHPKGALLVTINHNGFDAPKFVACDTIRFVNVEVDISEIDEVKECRVLIVEKISNVSNSLDGKRLIVRVEFIGRSALHKDIRDQVESGTMRTLLFSDYVSELGSTIIAGITSTVKPTYDLDELRKEDSLIGITLQSLYQMSDDEVISTTSQLVTPSALKYLLADDATAIRERTAMALVEAILDGGK
jgi:DNA repair exonuclease SbcCD nuclease subunit